MYPSYPYEIPMHGVDGKLCAYISADDIRKLGQSIEIVRTRRGHVKRVNLRGICAHTVRVMAGGNKQSFQQSVRSGRVWALKGVRGA